MGYETKIFNVSSGNKMKCLTLLRGVEATVCKRLFSELLFVGLNVILFMLIRKRDKGRIWGFS